MTQETAEQKFRREQETAAKEFNSRFDKSGKEPEGEEFRRRLDNIENVLFQNQLIAVDPTLREATTDASVWLGGDQGSDDFFWAPVDPTQKPVHVAVPTPPAEYFDGRDPLTVEEQAAYKDWLTAHLPAQAGRNLSSGVDANGQHLADHEQAKKKVYFDITGAFPPFAPAGSIGMGGNPPE